MTDAQLQLAAYSIVAAFEARGIGAAAERLRQELDVHGLRLLAAREPAGALPAGPDLSLLDTGD